MDEGISKFGFVIFSHSIDLVVSSSKSIVVDIVIPLQPLVTHFLSIRGPSYSPLLLGTLLKHVTTRLHNT